MAKTTFTKAASKRISNVVKTVEQQNPGLYGNEGQRDKKKESIMYRNDSSDSVPMGGIVWLYEKMTSGLYIGKKPNGSSLAFYGISGCANPAGGIGNAFINGTHRVLVTPAVYAAYTSSAYLGTKFTFPGTAIWEAIPSSAGLMLIVGKYSESPYFMVNITGGVGETGATGATGDDGADGADFEWIEAATKGALASGSPGPNFGYTTGAAKRYYLWLDGAWVSMSSFE